MKFIVILFLHLFLVGCSNSELAAPNRPKANAPTDTGHQESAVDNQGQLDANVNDQPISGNDSNSQSESSDNTEEAASDQGSSEPTLAESSENGGSDNKTTDDTFLLPVYEQFTGDPSSIRNFDYDIEQNGFTKVGFVVFAENSRAGLMPLMKCSDDGVPVNFLSNDTLCEGFTVIRRLGYVFKNHNDDDRDFLIRCYNLGKRDHAVELQQNIFNDICSTSNYKPVGPLGGVPKYEVITDQNSGAKKYVLKAP